MKYRALKGYKYQLAESIAIRLGVLVDVEFEHARFSLHDGVLTIAAGYCWDGASGPTYDDKKNMTPSLVHDVLYQAIRLGLLPPDRRADADYALNQLSRERGMGNFRRWVWFTGLNFFGAGAAKLRPIDPQDDILEAP